MALLAELPIPDAIPLKTAKNQEALLLTIGELSPECGNIAKVLGFFGIPWRTMTTEQFLSSPRSRTEGGPKSRLFCSSDAFCKLMAGQDGGLDGIWPWGADFH